MGIADIIPGISGGTIAFISGIYEELLGAIKSFNNTAWQLLCAAKLKECWQHIHGNFLLVLVLGIGVGFLAFVALVAHLLSHYPIQLAAFFGGLIIGSTIFIYKKIKKCDAGVILASIISIITAYWLTSITPTHTPETTWFIFLSGAIAVCAMILPGISGSFILLILGKYEYMIHALKNLNFSVIIIFLAGGITGLLNFSKLVHWLLTKYHNATIALLAGFMLGSLNKVWPWKQSIAFSFDAHGTFIPCRESNMSPFQFEKIVGKDPLILQALLYLAFGFLLVMIIEQWAKRKKFGCFRTSL